MIDKSTWISSSIRNSFCQIRNDINKMLIELLSNISLTSELYAISFNSNRTIWAFIFSLD